MKASAALMEELVVDNMERRKIDDAIRAAIRSNHLELNMNISHGMTHSGEAPVTCLSISSVVPSLQSLCRYVLCTNYEPLIIEKPPTVDACNMPNMDSLLQELKPTTKAQIEISTKPRLDFSVPWIVTKPENWNSMSSSTQRRLLSDFKNSVQLVELGLLSEDTIDLSYMDPNDDRAKKNPLKRKFDTHMPTFSLNDYDALIDELFEATDDMQIDMQIEI
jgi:hypothetical protein